MYNYLDTREKVVKAIESVNRFDYLVLDTETTGLNPHTAQLVDIQIGNEEIVYMFPAEFVTQLHSIKTAMIFVLQNWVYDGIILSKHGIDLRQWKVYDTSIMFHLYHNKKECNLEDMYFYLTGDKIPKSDFWKKYKNYLDAPFKERVEYACSDIKHTDKVFKELVKKDDFQISIT